MLNVEQLMAAQKTNMDAFFGFSQKAFEGMEKLVQLNTAAAKSALTETAAHTQALFGAKDPQEFMALQTAFFQPTGEKMAAFARHAQEISTSTTAEFVKAFEGQTAEAQGKFAELIENMSKNAPAGSEGAVAFFKNAMQAATNAGESMQKAVKQATDMAESNFNNMAAQTAQATKVAAKKR